MRKGTPAPLRVSIVGSVGVGLAWVGSVVCVVGSSVGGDAVSAEVGAGVGEEEEEEEEGGSVDGSGGGGGVVGGGGLSMIW